MAAVATHFGRWVRDEIGKRGEKQIHFAVRSGIPRSTLLEWLRTPAPNILPNSLKMLADALEVDFSDLQRELSEARNREGVALPRVTEVPILNRPGERVYLPDSLPIVDRVSASRWQTASGQEQGAEERFLSLSSPDVFVLMCDGDCMEPDWHDGELIVFSTVSVDRDGIKNGHDYGVLLKAESKLGLASTFKRATLDGTRLCLRCANGKYRKFQSVELDEVERIGKAMYAVRASPR